MSVSSRDPAVAVRPGEHACCRFESAGDRRRAASEVIREGLRRGHKVIYLGDAEIDGFTAELAALDEAVEPALARGQLEIVPARDPYAPGGAFDPEATLAWLVEHHDRALAEGYPGTTIAGEIGHEFSGARGAERLAEYERRLDELDFLGAVRLCQYDHASFEESVLSEASRAHDVDLAPELAAIGRSGPLAAARLRSGWLRLAGELDGDTAQDLGEVLESQCPDELRLDLADVRFVDVAGMRALRGRSTRPVRIAASAPVDRLLELLGWDTDPAVTVVEAV